MPIASTGAETSPAPFQATNRAAKLLAEQDRALGRILGPNIGEYFRTLDQLRRAVAHVDRAANLAANAGIAKVVADARPWPPVYGASGAVAKVAEQKRNWQKLGQSPSIVPAGIAKAAFEAQQLSAAYGTAGVSARLAEDVRARQKLIADDTAANVAKLSRVAAVSMRTPMISSTSAALLEIAAQMRERHQLINTQNSALLATMSIKRGLLAAPPAIPSIDSAVDTRALAASALISESLARAIAAQVRGAQNLLGEHTGALIATASLGRGLLASQLATSSIRRSLLASQLATPSFATAFNFRASALGTLLDSLGSLRLGEWIATDNAPTWEEIYGIALRELRAELRGQPLGRAVQIHLALFVLEAVLTTTPALSNASRDEIHKGFLIAHAIALGVTGYRRALR